MSTFILQVILYHRPRTGRIWSIYRGDIEERACEFGQLRSLESSRAARIPPLISERPTSTRISPQPSLLFLLHTCYSFPVSSPNNIHTPQIYISCKHRSQFNTRLSLSPTQFHSQMYCWTSFLPRSTSPRGQDFRIRTFLSQPALSHSLRCGH